MDTQNAFLEELAAHLDYWVEALRRSVTDDSEDLLWTDAPEAFRRLRTALQETDAEGEFIQVIREGMRGLLCSVLTTFDGGTVLAEKDLLTITDSKGDAFENHLHELFAALLVRSGRIE